jgi:hypothetical protein
MKRDTCRQKLQIFLTKFLPTSILGVSAATRAENLVEWIMNDYNLDGEHNRSENGRSCTGHFVQYHPLTLTSNLYLSCCTFMGVEM